MKSDSNQKNFQLSAKIISAALNISEEAVDAWVDLQLETKEANDKQLYDVNPDFNEHIDLNNEVEIADSSFSRSYILFMTDRFAYKSQLEAWKADQDQQQIELVKSNVLPLRENAYRISLLINKIQSKRITPFLGAGMSMAAGLPGWSQFLQICGKACGVDVAELNKLLEKGEFERGADLILAHTHPELLKEKFLIHFKEPQQGTYAHEIIARIANWGVVTTNYDKLIERTYERFDSKFKDIFYGPEEEMQNEFIDGNNVLLKLHGDINRPSKRILNSSEYNKVYGMDQIDFNLPLPKFFSSFFSTFGILFIGCSLSSDRTMKLLKAIKSMDSKASHFALVPAPTSDLVERERFLAEHGIFPIWYPEGQHEYVEYILTYIFDNLEA